jgi:hypothetical protein
MPRTFPAVAGLLVGASLCLIVAATPEGARDMEITSEEFDPGGTIPARSTCDGDDVSPALEWGGVPEGARSLVLIMDDPDAPPGTWVHWVLYDLPPDGGGLAGGIAEKERLEDGSVHGACWGVKSFSRIGYHGPCPPPGRPHRYVFKLYALDAKLDLPPRKTVAEIEQAMKDHVLAEATLTGLYGR